MKTKEEIFLAEMGIHSEFVVEASFSAKYKLKDLLKKYSEQCNAVLKTEIMSKEDKIRKE